MEKQILGVTYRLSKEEVEKAVEHWLTVIMNQKDVTVEKVDPEFSKEYYSISNFEESYREVFDGIRVVCKYK